MDQVPEAWPQPEMAVTVEPGAEGAVAELTAEIPYHPGPTAPETPIVESDHKGGMAPDTSLAVSEATLQRMMESNQLIMNKTIELTMAPMLNALKALQDNSVKKEDLRSFKEEMRQEVRQVIDATLTKDAFTNKQVGNRVDPWAKKDPWIPGKGWDAYNLNQAAGASSSGPAQADQGATFQIPPGKWHPQGESAKTAVRGAAEKFQQQQHAATGSTDLVPSQVFIRGWSNWGDTNGISKSRAAEIWNLIKAELMMDVERLIINFTVFDPIQRIAIHVMELAGVAIHVRDKIQQAVSKLSLQQDGKDLQIVIQKPPQIRKMNGQLNDKQREINKFFRKTSDEIRPVWSDHNIKGPGGAVLGRFDNRGGWKWSGQNIERALKVEEASVAEFMALQSTDW